MKYLSLFVLLIFWYPLLGQRMYMFKEDLQKEMRYKVAGNSIEDRGFDLFQRDLNRLLRKSSVFKKDEYFSIGVFISIRFLEGQGSPSQYVRVSIPESVLDQEKKEAEIQRIVGALVSDWRPALHQDKEVYGSYYYISLLIRKGQEQEKGLGIQDLRVEATTDKTKYGEHCLKLYNVERDNELLKYLFIMSEIMPEYKGGINRLAIDINTLLDTTNYLAVDRVQDSCVINFITDRAGHFGLLDTYKVSNYAEELILTQLRRLSCNWLPSLSSGRPLNSSNKYQFVYSYLPNDTSKERLQMQLKVENVKRLRAEPVITSVIE